MVVAKSSLRRTEGMGRGLFWTLAHPESCLLVYGLSWVLREYRGRVVVQHGGAIDSMCSVVALIPEEKLGVVILSNLGKHLLPYALVCRVFDAYLKAKPRDWSAELFKVHEGLEKQQKEAEKRIEKERVQGTKPSLWRNTPALTRVTCTARSRSSGRKTNSSCITVRP